MSEWMEVDYLMRYLGYGFLGFLALAMLNRAPWATALVLVVVVLCLR